MMQAIIRGAIPSAVYLKKPARGRLLLLVPRGIEPLFEE